MRSRIPSCVQMHLIKAKYTRATFLQSDIDFRYVFLSLKMNHMSQLIFVICSSSCLYRINRCTEIQSMRNMARVFFCSNEKTFICTLLGMHGRI